MAVVFLTKGQLNVIKWIKTASLYTYKRKPIENVKNFHCTLFRSDGMKNVLASSFFTPYSKRCKFVLLRFVSTRPLRYICFI